MIGVSFLLGIGMVLPDRAEFCRAQQSITQGTPMAEVRRKLGPPDDIQTDRDPDIEEDETVWRYGTNGHNTLATLGVVSFQAGLTIRSYVDRRLPPPPTSVIAEQELRDLLRKIHHPFYPRRAEEDALWLVRTGNALIAAGESKAIAALLEYEQIERISDARYQWLLRIIFEPPADPGYLPKALIYSVDAPNLKSPRLPLIIEDDIPFMTNVFPRAGIGGAPPSISYALESYRSKCHFRSAAFMPPDDPFESYLRLLKGPQWPFPPYVAGEKNGFIMPYAVNEGWALGAVLSLVRTAYRTRDLEPYGTGYGVNGLDFEKYHKEFLATGPLWDPVRQMYVPKDGKLLLDDDRIFLPVRVKVKAGDVRISVTVIRRSSTDVDYEMKCRTKQPLRAFVVIRDAATGKALNLGSPITEEGVENERKTALSRKFDAEAKSFDSDWSYCFDIAEGKDVIIEIFTSTGGVFRQTVRP